MAIGARIWRRVKRINWMHLDCFERRLSRFFEAYGAFVSRHPWPFIIFPVLISAVLSVGFLHKYEVTDATYLYTPLYATSKYERGTIHEKWPLIDGTYLPGKEVTTLRGCQSIVTAKDGGNILRPEYAEAINRLNLYVIDRIKVNYQNRIYGYTDLCLHWEDTCWTNAQVGLVSTVYNNPDPNWVNLTYPTAVFGTTRGYLGSSLGGVTVNATTNLIEAAQAWLLLYQLQFEPENISYVSGLWELEFQKRLLEYSDPFIRITVFHSQTLALELKRNAEKLTPRFAVSFGILVLFAMIATYAFIPNSDFPYVDWVVSKPSLAFFGVVGAGLGISSTLGLLAYCGYIYNQIVSVMPFLIISVRLDNTFLMISALRHTSRTLPAHERISEAMAEAASAITITVSTDFFSFLVGVTADIPAVQVFCVYTAVAVVLTFIFQLTFFLGLLVLAARSEEKGLNAMVWGLETVSPKEAKERNIFTRLFNQGSRIEVTSPVHHNSSSTDSNKPPPAAEEHLDFMSKWFHDWYAPVLMHPVMRGLVLFWFCCYLAVSGYLCCQVRQGMEPVKLLVSGSYAIPHYKSMERYFWIQGCAMQLVINNAPNLADLRERQRIKDMVTVFSSTSHSMGNNSVEFWFDDFERYLRDYNLGLYITETFDDPDDYYGAVQRFLSLNTYEKLRQDILWTNVTAANNETRYRIKSFRLMVGLSRFQTAELQIETVNMMRSLAGDRRFADFNITTFNPVWLFVDQYQEILPNVIQEVIGGVGFMIMIALLLIPHPMTSLWVAVTIISVDVGVIGFMTIWGINLDTISMITIIMSIGFSVDFAAHIAHAFVVSSDPNDRAVDKVKRALGEVAWPILQGGTSMVLGVVVLSDLDSYMVVAFFKTVFLVIILALLHGLVFLPVLLSVFVPKRCGGKKKKSKKGTAAADMETSKNGFNHMMASEADLVQHAASNGHRRYGSSVVYPTDAPPYASSAM